MVEVSQLLVNSGLRWILTQMFQGTIVLEIGPLERCCYSIDGGELFVLSAGIWRIFNPDVFRVC